MMHSVNIFIVDLQAHFVLRINSVLELKTRVDTPLLFVVLSARSDLEVIGQLLYFNNTAQQLLSMTCNVENSFLSSILPAADILNMPECSISHLPHISCE